MSQDLHTNIEVRGHLSMVFRNTKTGEIVDIFDEPQIVLTQGKGEIIKAMTVRDTNSHSINTIVIGDDVGTGTIMVPQAPTTNLTEANQNELYTIPTEEFFIEYPTETSVRFSATINGAAVMALYPSQPNIVYTSATLRNLNGKAICYKRFSGRTISSLISVDVTWTLTFL